MSRRKKIGENKSKKEKKEGRERDSKEKHEKSQKALPVEGNQGPGCAQ